MSSRHPSPSPKRNPGILYIHVSHVETSFGDVHLLHLLPLLVLFSSTRLQTKMLKSLPWRPPSSGCRKTASPCNSGPFTTAPPEMPACPESLLLSPAVSVGGLNRDPQHEHLPDSTVLESIRCLPALRFPTGLNSHSGRIGSTRAPRRIRPWRRQAWISCLSPRIRL